jgi:hypothetical protein
VGYHPQRSPFLLITTGLLANMSSTSSHCVLAERTGDITVLGLNPKWPDEKAKLGREEERQL